MTFCKREGTVGKLVLYHGSKLIVKNPDVAHSRPAADFGFGFYCTASKVAAEEWAACDGTDGFVNAYSATVDSFKLLDLTESRDCLLPWISLLLSFRMFRIATPLVSKSCTWLQNFYPTDISRYDCIKAFRADDSYFSCVKKFLNGEISVGHLWAVLYGDSERTVQFVLKKPKLAKTLIFMSGNTVQGQIMHSMRVKNDLNVRKKLAQPPSEDDALFIKNLIINQELGYASRL